MMQFPETPHERLVLIGYALMLATFALLVTWLVTLGIAWWLPKQTTDPILLSHCRWQMKQTLICVGVCLSGFIVMAPTLLGWSIMGGLLVLGSGLWFIYAAVFGTIRLLNGLAMPEKMSE